MKLRDAVEKRRDVKRYDLKKPDWRKVIRAIDAARFGSSAGNHFAVRFIYVDDKKIIEKLSMVSQQTFVSKAKVAVVIVSDPSSLVRSYGERGVKYCRLQAGAAIQNFLLSLEDEGLASSWVWYFEDSQIKSLLDIPDGGEIEGIFPVGIKTKISSVKKRNVELDNILFFGKYGEKKMTPMVKVKRESV